MKKRVIAMILALWMIFTLVACDEKEYGEFYTEDDVLQNTLIECVVTQVEADTVSYEIRNGTSYALWIKSVALHVFQDGVWEKPLFDDGYIWVDRENLGGWRGTYQEVYENTVNFDSYKNIHPGEYRIVVKMEARENRNSGEIKEVCATAYFTVTDAVYGVFEEKNGVFQNSLVTVQVGNYSLRAPLLSLYYHVENKSAFDVEVQCAEDENYPYRLELLENGEWKPCPIFGKVVGEGVDKKNFWTKEQVESGVAELMDQRYIALEAGEYRVRVKYIAVCGVEGVEIPEGQLEAVAYFTVSAPVQ